MSTDDAMKELDGLEVTELDDRELDAVAGGVASIEADCTNGNCNGCPPGTNDPNGCANANC